MLIYKPVSKKRTSVSILRGIKKLDSIYKPKNTSSINTNNNCNSNNDNNVSNIKTTTNATTTTTVNSANAVPITQQFNSSISCNNIDDSMNNNNHHLQQSVISNAFSSSGGVVADKKSYSNNANATSAVAEDEIDYSPGTTIYYGSTIALQVCICIYIYSLKR